ncbi:MAG: hypothetical protein OK454_02135, partial [Thaumarchaeota archaeon]|nr:hypothetical protein [Nitrososphaerota archaeon]
MSSLVVVVRPFSRSRDPDSLSALTLRAFNSRLILEPSLKPPPPLPTDAERPAAAAGPRTPRNLLGLDAAAGPSFDTCTTPSGMVGVLARNGSGPGLVKSQDCRESAATMSGGSG